MSEDAGECLVTTPEAVQAALDEIQHWARPADLDPVIVQAALAAAFPIMLKAFFKNYFQYNTVLTKKAALYWEKTRFKNGETNERRG